MFEWGHPATEMKGVTVEKWVWTNPHTLPLRQGRRRQPLGVRRHEPEPPRRAAGWSKRSLAPARRSTSTYYKLRDERRRGGFNVTVTKPDGAKLRQLPVRIDVPLLIPGTGLALSGRARVANPRAA